MKELFILENENRGINEPLRCFESMQSVATWIMDTINLKEKNEDIAAYDYIIHKISNS